MKLFRYNSLYIQIVYRFSDACLAAILIILLRLAAESFMIWYLTTVEVRAL